MWPMCWMPHIYFKLNTNSDPLALSGSLPQTFKAIKKHSLLLVWKKKKKKEQPTLFCQTKLKNTTRLRVEFCCYSTWSNFDKASLMGSNFINNIYAGLEFCISRMCCVNPFEINLNIKFIKPVRIYWHLLEGGRQAGGVWCCNKTAC